MSAKVNILIASAGSRNKIVEYFKSAIGNEGSIITADADNLAPATYISNKRYLVPRVDEQGYIDAMIDICKRERVNLIISLIDPELSVLAYNRDKFEAIGTTVMVSDYDLTEISLDKYRMYLMLKQLCVSTVRSYRSIEEYKISVKAGETNYPIFVKPCKGSASININMVQEEYELDFLSKKYNNLLIQEYMNGEEFGADVYVDMISRKVVSIFLKKKIKMRAGETDKSVSYKDEKLFKKIVSFVERAGYIGMIDIDIFKQDDVYYISEVNPRFGGGYPHAYECGVDVPSMIVNNIRGIVNKVNIGSYEEGIYMMKYSDLVITKELY